MLVLITNLGPLICSEELMQCSVRNLTDYFYEFGKLRFSSISAQGYPEGAVYELRRQLHCGQHMTAVALGAGGACGYTDARILQNVNGILGGHAGNGNRENMRRVMRTVDCYAVKFT